MINTNYTPKIILQKDFKKKAFKGYDPVEVDEFLDNVIKDYEMMMKRISSLESEVEEIAKDQAKSASPVAKTIAERFGGTPNDKAAAPTPGTTNFDILKRLANLEKAVFGDKVAKAVKEQNTKIEKLDEDTAGATRLF
ncbi:MAG: cell division regulator GpsB [Lactobacillales bacterium]|nr:cell division regulator GpsB [Lactobacillales bacterium]